MQIVWKENIQMFSQILYALLVAQGELYFTLQPQMSAFIPFFFDRLYNVSMQLDGDWNNDCEITQGDFFWENGYISRLILAITSAAAICT